VIEGGYVRGILLKMTESGDATLNELLIDQIEGISIKAAKKEKISIRIEKDKRGRYPSITVRAVGPQKDETVLARKIDGVKVK
jgi:hypothetical protein